MIDRKLDCPICHVELIRLMPRLDIEAHLYKYHPISDVVTAFTKLVMKETGEADTLYLDNAYWQCPLCEYQSDSPESLKTHLTNYHTIQTSRHVELLRKYNVTARND